MGVLWKRGGVFEVDSLKIVHESSSARLAFVIVWFAKNDNDHDDDGNNKMKKIVNAK